MSTIHNIVSIFEHFTDQLNFDKTNFNNPDVWNKINDSIRRIYRIENFLGSNFKIEEKQPLFDEYQYRKGPNCKLNEEIIENKINDLIEVEFVKFYPNIICRLYEEGFLNIDMKSEPYYFFVKNSDQIKPLLSKEGRIVFNLYINYFFGWKISNEEKIKVVGRAWQIIEIFTKYDEWIYSDTDHFFLKDNIGLIDKLHKELSYLELPYEIKLIKEAVFFGRKKFFYIDSDGMGKMVGFNKKIKK
jgi:hypothetical protein